MADPGRSTSYMTARVPSSGRGRASSRAAGWVNACKVEGCETMVGLKGARGLCPLHYVRWRRTGTVESRPCATCGAPIKRGWGLSGPKYCSDDCKPRCSVDGCEQPSRKRTWCASHYAQWQRTGEAPRPFLYKWGSDEVTYSGVHMRLRAERGAASDHSCAHCGQTARQWAHDHSDSDVRRDRTGLPFSVDLRHYFPLCGSCHKRFDLAHREPSTALVDAGGVA